MEAPLVQPEILGAVVVLEDQEFLFIILLFANLATIQAVQEEQEVLAAEVVDLVQQVYLILLYKVAGAEVVLGFAMQETQDHLITKEEQEEILAEGPGGLLHQQAVFLGNQAMFKELVVAEDLGVAVVTVDLAEVVVADEVA